MIIWIFPAEVLSMKQRHFLLIYCLIVSGMVLTSFTISDEARSSGNNTDLASAQNWTRPESGDANTYKIHQLLVKHQIDHDDFQYQLEIFRWHLLAAGQGNPDSPLKVGIMYREGIGVPLDYDSAVKWLILSAEQGNASAQNNLGEMYYHGKGVHPDFEAAFNWYLLAAKQGDLDSQYNLGVMYANGHGVKQNWVSAYMWMDVVANRGDVGAAETRAKFAKNMTFTQIEEAKELARECVRNNYKEC